MEDMELSLDKLNENIQTLQHLLEQGETESIPTRYSEELLSEHDLDCHHFFVQRLEHAIAARDAWLDYLTLKYRLNAGDEVTPQGVILRRVE